MRCLKNVVKIEIKKPLIKQKRRVAAYARVSMKTERLHHSLSAQISYYNSYINSNPEWTFVGIYADEGISGTKTSNRLEFNRMLDDCNKGLIDLILVKSISRFARNTLDVLNVVRDLKSKGIEVYFEKEKISSLTKDGELMLTLLASFAEEESRSISSNVKWGTIKRFKQGIPNGKFRVTGYKWVDDKLVIDEDTAWVIRLMFDLYLNGKSRTEIEHILDEKGIRTVNGKKYVDSNIAKILRNSVYKGDLLMQKEYVVDPITKKHKINRGELPQYLVEDHHEPIVSKEDFAKAQEIREMRARLGPVSYTNVHTTCFTSKIKCAKCGKSYRRSGKRQGKDKHVYYTWVCRTKSDKGSAYCNNSKNIPENELKRICAEVLNIQEFDEDIFKIKINKIVVIGEDVLEFHFYDGNIMKIKWESLARTSSWSAARRKAWGEYQSKVQKGVKKHAKSYNNTSNNN